MWSTALFILALLAFKETEGVNKRWVKTWDLDAPSNWENRKLPCSGKVATLPRHPSNAIFLGDRVTAASLELPTEGQLIFGDGANLVLDDTPLDNCQDTEWNHHGHDSWWDPEGWSYPDFDDPTTSPVPHIHRIPCTRDEALFTHPNQSLYSVHLTPPVITVSKISIGNQDYSTSELATYARTKEGRFRFVGVSSQSDNALLYVERPHQCIDITGCLCGTEGATTIICNIMKQKCPEAICENPISMKGFCCKICGAEVIIAHNGSLSLSAVRNLLKEHLAAPVAQHISAYSSKMDDNLFHVYFTAVNEHGNYRAASEAFKTKFEKELNAEGQHTTLLAYAGDITPKKRKGPSAHSVAAAFITLAICLALGLAVYYFRKRRITSQLSFMFRRLESNSRRVSVVSDVGGRRLSTTSTMLTPSYSREGGLRFLNPIFNQSMASLVGAGLGERRSGSMTTPEDQVEGQHENLMYTAYEKMTPEERQASEDTLRAQEEIIESGSEPMVNLDHPPPNKQEVKVHSPLKTDLDVITEEKDSNAELGDSQENNSTEIQESGNESLMNKAPNSPTQITNEGESHDSDLTELSKSKVNTDLSLDSLLLEGSSMDTLVTTDDISQAAAEHEVSDNKTLKETTESPIPADTISISSSSTYSDNGNDVHMDIEGFVPLTDLRFKK